jgi:hypothetical protein
VKINFVNTPRSESIWRGLTLRHFDFGEESCHFDLTLSLGDSDAGLRIALQYNYDLFSEETIAHVLADYEFILDRMSANPEIELGTLRALVSARIDDRRNRQIQLDRQEQQLKLTNFRRKLVTTS